jgi:DNA-binding CsgD family transcriptional regulator
LPSTPRSLWRPDRVCALHAARETEILRLVADGKTNREIAAALYISPGTVRKHLDNIYEELDVANRAQAVARYFRIDANT